MMAPGTRRARMGRWSPLRVAGTAILHPAVAGVVGASLAVVVLVAGQKPSPRPRTTFVELDAVVVDGNGPVRGLHRDDFQVQEDGRKVAVTSFTEVSAAGIAGDADGRSVALLLDDT